MARYQRIMPIADNPEISFAKIYQFLQGKGYRYETTDNGPVFRKGDGFWVLGRFVKITYQGAYVCVEAWVLNAGREMDLEGFYGCAGKKPLKKLVVQIEAILAQQGTGFVPAEAGTEVPLFTQTAPVLPAGITKKEYLKHYAGADFKRQLKGAAIFGYVVAGLNAVAGLLAAPLALIDMAIVLGLSLGMHLGKSKGCAIGLLTYGILSTLLTLVLYGQLAGWLMILIGALAVQVFRKAEARYKELTGRK